MADESFFTSQTPANFFFDATGVSLGITLRFALDGVIKGFRYYAHTSLTGGTYTGGVYSVDTQDGGSGSPGTGTGTLLDSATYGTLTAGAWNTVTLGSPLSVTANTLYRVEGFSSVGRYAVAAAGLLSSDVTNGNITAIADNTSYAGKLIRNGSYKYAGSLTYAQDFGGGVYMVDVIYEATASAVLARPAPYVISAGLVVPVSRPIVVRSTLADPPVLTTPRPIVVTGRPTPGLPLALLLRSPAPAPPTPSPIVVTAPPVQQLVRPLVLRSTLADPPVLTTRPPLVVTAPPPPPPPAAILVRNPAPDVPAVSGPTTVPIVVTAPPGPPPATVRVLRAHLQDAIVATPQPLVVTAPTPVTPARPILSRSSLADVLAATQPLVVTAPPSIARSTPILVRNAPATAAPASAATPAPIVVTAPQVVTRGLAVLIRSTAPTAAPTTFSSPNPELVTASAGRNLATLSHTGDLITSTHDRDLEV